MCTNVHLGHVSVCHRCILHCLGQNFKKLTYLVGYNILEETFFKIKNNNNKSETLPALSSKCANAHGVHRSKNRVSNVGVTSSKAAESFLVHARRKIRPTHTDQKTPETPETFTNECGCLTVQRNLNLTSQFDGDLA